MPSRRLRLLALCSLIALVAGGLGVQHLRSARAAEALQPDPSQVDGDHAGLERRLAQLAARVSALHEGSASQRELSALRAELLALRAREPAEADDREEDLEIRRREHAGTHLDAAEAIAEERKQTQAAVALMESKLAAESADPAWAAEAQGALASTFEIPELKGHSQLEDVACQASLCRMRARHEDEHAATLLLTRLGHHRTFGQSEAFSEHLVGDDGSVQTVTYITREGHRLPRP